MYKNIIFTLTLLFLIFSKYSYSQETLPFYEQYLISDKTLINPSYTGSTDDWVVKGTYNKHWANFEGGPNTQTLLTHANIVDRVGLGLYVFKDENGPVSLNGLNLSAAYHIPLTSEEDRNDRFSFGASTTFMNQIFDITMLNPRDLNDPALSSDNLTVFIPYLNLGTSIHYKGAFLGVSVLDIPLGAQRQIVNQIEPLPSWYYFNLGYDWDFAENFSVEPSIMMTLNSNSSRNLDANIKAKYFQDQTSFAFGLSYRQALDKNGSQALTFSPFVQAELNRLYFGFSYNLGLSDIAKEGGNGFTISLGYNIENLINSNGFRYR